MRKDCFSLWPGLVILSVTLGFCLPAYPYEDQEFFVAQRAFEDSFYDASLTLFQRFIDKNSESSLRAQAEFYIGQCYFYQRKYADALAEFNKLLDFPKAESFRDKIYYWIGEVYFKINDYGRAYVFYEKLSQEYPQSTYALHAFYSLGWCLLGQGKFQEAKEKLLAFKDKFPQDPLAEEAAFKAAECLYNLKNYAELKDYLESFSKEYPKTAKTTYLRFYLAESAFYLGDYSLAISNYAKALEAVTDTNLASLINFGLGWSYLKSNDYANARSSFDKVVQASSDKKNIESALLGEAIALQMSAQYKEAVDTYTSLIKEGVSQKVIYEAYLGKAEALSSLDSYKDAALVYIQAKGYINTDTPDFLVDRFHYGLGLNCLKSGDFEEAKQEFSYILSHSKDEALKISALSHTADSQVKTGDTDKAIKIYEDILKDYPDCESCDYVRYALGAVLFNLKRHAEAIDIFKIVIDKYPNSKVAPETTFYLAAAYFEKGDFLNSRLQLEDFINKYPTSDLRPRALLLEGLSLKSLGKYQDALDIFKITLNDYNQDLHISARAEFEIADCLYYLDRKPEAVERLESLRSKYADPEVSTMVLWRLAEHYFKENNLDLSKRYLLDIVQGHPENLLLDDAYYMLGLCFEKQQRYQEALESFNKVKGTKFEAYLKIADSYKALGNYPEAIFYYRLGLNEETVDKPVLQFKLAECFEESGDLNKAVAEYSQISKDSVLALKGLLRTCQILERQENWEAALRAYKEIAGLDVEEAKFAKERIAVIEENYLVRDSAPRG